jgi:5-methylcytosine-specific restriction protein A
VTPTGAKRVCSRCRATIPAGPCPTCAPKAKAAAEARRPSSTDRGYKTPAWLRCRKLYLAAHPYCQGPKCSKLPLARRPLAQHVDHLDGQGPLGPRGLDWSNLQGLCAPEHSAKTAARDGGFGNPRKATP